MEELLKIKGVVFFPGEPFLPKTSSFVVHFGSKSGPRNYKKDIQTLYSKIYQKNAPKSTPKCYQNDFPNRPREAQNDSPEPDTH